MEKEEEGLQKETELLRRENEKEKLEKEANEGVRQSAVALPVLIDGQIFGNYSFQFETTIRCFNGGAFGHY